MKRSKKINDPISQINNILNKKNLYNKDEKNPKKKLSPINNDDLANIDKKLSFLSKENIDDSKLDNNKNSQKIKKDYFNKLGIKRINFQFEDYGEYPDEDFQPSIFFFKFLSGKPEYEKEGNKVRYIRATDIYTPFLVGPEAGYLISNVNAPKGGH